MFLKKIIFAKHVTVPRTFFEIGRPYVKIEFFTTQKTKFKKTNNDFVGF